MTSFLKKLKVGDIITAYRKGIHIITKIEHRFFTEKDTDYGNVGEEYNSLIYYKQLVTGKFKEVKSKREYCCDEHYCTVIDDDWITAQYEELERQMAVVADLKNRFKELK